ncbi:MAG: hypothetical protein KatS3mg113_0716 [Planctomycetaceae bacterium]|nr:MAG: hypothetical protein KatS3mg113_0716 [Planctomycetaceae bacterium]
MYQGSFRRCCTRRQIVQAGVLGLGGLSLPLLWAGRTMSAATSSPTRKPAFGRAKSCIFLFMWGGPAHQDTWDLKPQAPPEIRGEFQPIATAVPGIHICEHFVQMAQRTDHLTIIRSMTHNNVDHTPSTHFLLTGHPPPASNNLADDWPSIGSVLSALNRGHPPLPPYVQMRPTVPGDVPRFVEQSHGQFAGWLSKQFNPLTIDANPALPDYRVGEFEPLPELPLQRLDRRHRILRLLDLWSRNVSAQSPPAVMQTHYERAFELLQSSQARHAFDLSQEPASIREKYGLNPHGQSVLQARRLIERGVALVTVFWPNDGIKNVSVYWDTHSRNFIDLKTRLIPPADQAFAALLDDLAERGLLDETLIIWSGEFGRTPRIGQVNSDAGAGADGRDHWPHCFTTVLAGAGLPKGCVYGASDRHAAYPALNPIQPMQLVATIYHLLGVSPELTLHDAQGRPLVLCPADPLWDLLG